MIVTPSHRLHAHSHFDLFFAITNRKRRVKLTLSPSDGIIPEGATAQYLRPDGTISRTEPIERHEYKIYTGDVWTENERGSWMNVGSARITVHEDGMTPLFEGTFSVMHDWHHVHLYSKYLQFRATDEPVINSGIGEEHMVVFRDSEIGQRQQVAHLELKRDISALSCSSDLLGFNHDTKHALYQSFIKAPVSKWSALSAKNLLGKRQIDVSGIPGGGNSGSVNLASTIGSVNGCPSARKVALIGVAADCSYVNSFAPSADLNSAVKTHIIQQINAASDIYLKTFNITLGLQNLTIMDPGCPGSVQPTTPWNVGCNTNQTITDRLNSFSQWRGQHQDSNAYWTLLTNCATGSEVGLAWLGQLCINTAASVGGESISGANVVARTPTEWQVIAHESGHTFGAVHDCDAQTCSDGKTVAAQQCCPLSGTSCNANAQYIMNPSTGDRISTFSPCTIGNICTAFLRNSVRSDCLADNKGVTTISGQVCGNGVVEEGEDCDCGKPEECIENKCCNPLTCKFINNAVCDDSNEECCVGCQFATNGTLCRGSTGVCDPQEVCTGKSASCPNDVTAPDGQGCGVGLQCASGQCTSRNQQCMTLMGAYTNGNNDTYACNSQDCTVSCASPQFGPGVSRWVMLIHP